LWFLISNKYSFSGRSKIISPLVAISLAVNKSLKVDEQIFLFRSRIDYEKHHLPLLENYWHKRNVYLLRKPL
jgi:hypothetical protein